jgi:deazaflavin-dependent oxidoreductase (nitroreductase family)
MALDPTNVHPTLWKLITGANVALYRLTGGRLGATVRGVPVLLLDHVGRRSGERRTTPLMYLEDGDDLVIVASKGGAPAHPAWWLNLQANPRTTVQVGSVKRPVMAREAAPDEKSQLWPRLVDLYPDYQDYQQRTERQIPVVILEPPPDVRGGF